MPSPRALHPTHFPIWLNLALLALLLPALAGCGRALGYDARRLERKCEVIAGVELSAEQARCVARVAGLRDGRKCPLRQIELETASGTVYRFEESCAEVGLEVDGRTGRVVAVALGAGEAPSSPQHADGS